jgi:hypothetical protein
LRSVWSYDLTQVQMILAELLLQSQQVGELEERISMVRVIILFYLVF